MPPRPEIVARALDPHADAQILLGDARELERNGFWEDAAGLRGAVLQGPLAATLAPEALADARLNQIRLLLKLNRAVEAEAILIEFGPAPDNDAALVLKLLKARTLTALGETRAAIDAYESYLADGGAAMDAVRLLRAALHLDAGDPTAALADYEATATNPEATAADVESALLNGGLILENAGSYAEARHRYQTLYDVSPWVADDTFALQRLGAAAFAESDEEAAVAAWDLLLQQYPWHPRAAEAYEGLRSRGIPINPLSEGLFLYRQFRLSDAQAVYEAFLARDPATPEAAVARYYIAAIDEDRGNDSDAIRGYLASANEDPAGPLAGDALWWAARLLEGRGQVGLAGALYMRLHDGYAGSTFAAEAGFRAGLVRFLADDLEKAETRFVALALATEATDAQRAWLWAGKSRALQDDGSGAEAAFRRAAQIDPWTYYGLRALAHLAAEPLAPTLAGSTLGALDAPEPTQTEAWLQAVAGPEPPAPSAQFDQSVAWQAGLQLERAGLPDLADRQFGLHLATVGDDLWLLYRSAGALDKLGRVDLRLRAAVRILETLPAAQQAGAPIEILRWAYPRGWPALAAQEAAERGVDELLIYALIRQESRFAPNAGSIAGALGLTQVIPPTAADIAEALADESFDVSLLVRPERSIRYGAYYLSEQLRTFDGAAWLALAAYNGGPGNAFRWSNDDSGIDPDLFYERITFAETRAYVQLVLENYAWYQFIYRGGSGPSLVSRISGAALATGG